MLEEELVKLINETKVFVSGELPDVIEQLLLWHNFKYASFVLLGCLLIVAAYKLHKMLVDTDGEDAFNYVAPAALGVIGLVWSIVSFANLLKIWLAPKVYLLEYAATLT